RRLSSKRNLRPALSQPGCKEQAIEVYSRLWLSGRLISIFVRSCQRHARIWKCFKQSVRNYHPWSVSLGGFGECLARYENQVSINKDVVDAWGIPALHIDMEFGDNERALVDDMG